MLRTTSEDLSESFQYEDQVHQNEQQTNQLDEEQILSPLSVLDMIYSSDEFVSDSGEESDTISDAHSCTGEVSPEIGGQINDQNEQHHNSPTIQMLMPGPLSIEHHSVDKDCEAEHVPYEHEVASVEVQKECKIQDYGTGHLE
jgi:hypothetical protein